MDLAPRRQYTVSELTGEIAGILSTEFTNIWVSGEVSGLKVATSGHAYFTLKDDGAQIRCACWKGSYRLLRFKPHDGLALVARGRVEVYEPRGEYQLIVETIEPLGQGALQLAFEQLKKRLEAEGLFAAGRKRALPKYPAAIGLVTSAAGAALRDMLNILARRAPWVRVVIQPVRVQGEGAAAEIARLADMGIGIGDAWCTVRVAAAAAILPKDAPTMQ